MDEYTPLQEFLNLNLTRKRVLGYGKRRIGEIPLCQISDVDYLINFIVKNIGGYRIETIPNERANENSYKIIIEDPNSDFIINVENINNGKYRNLTVIMDIDGMFDYYIHKKYDIDDYEELLVNDIIKFPSMHAKGLFTTLSYYLASNNLNSDEIYDIIIHKLMLTVDSIDKGIYR